MAPQSRCPGLSDRITDSAGATRQISRRMVPGRSISSLIFTASEHQYPEPNLTRSRQEEDFRPPLTSAWV